MKKYNLDDLKAIPKDEAFSEDVNQDAYEEIEKINKNFNAQIDIKGMKFYELPGNKFWGPFYAFGIDGKLYGTFEFIKGVCYTWTLVRYFGNSQAHITRFNSRVYKGKNKKNPNGEIANINQQTHSEETND